MMKLSESLTVFIYDTTIVYIWNMHAYSLYMYVYLLVGWSMIRQHILCYIDIIHVPLYLLQM